MTSSVDLIDFLGGHAMRKAMMEFEKVLNPFVKDSVRAYFPEDPNDVYTIAFKDDLGARKRARDLQCESLTQEQAATATLLHQLQRQLDVKDKTPKKQVKALQKRMFAIVDGLSKLDNEDEKRRSKNT